MSRKQLSLIIINRALAKNAEERYQTGAEFARDIRAIHEKLTV